MAVLHARTAQLWSSVSGRLYRGHGCPSYSPKNGVLLSSSFLHLCRPQRERSEDGCGLHTFTWWCWRRGDATLFVCFPWDRAGERSVSFLPRMRSTLVSLCLAGRTVCCHRRCVSLSGGRDSGIGSSHLFVAEHVLFFACSFGRRIVWHGDYAAAAAEGGHSLLFLGFAQDGVSGGDAFAQSSGASSC